MPDTDNLLAAIDSYAGQSLASGAADAGELSRQRSLALDAYAGKMLDVPSEGRSQVNDRSVFETVQWIMPSMMRIFAGGDNVVEFDPTGPEDEEVAEQESDYLNYMVTQKNDWDLTVREWCQDALLTKNAYCLVDMVERLSPEKNLYEGQSEEQVALLMEDELEVVGQRQYDDPNDPGIMLDPTTGQPIDPQDQATMLGAMAIYEASGVEPQVQRKQLFDIEVKQVKAKQSLKFDVLPPERCRVGQDTRDFTLEDCNYFEYWDLSTISDLRKLGMDVPDDIGDDGFESTSEDWSRDEPLESDTEVDEADPAMRQVTVRTIWIRHDYDEDGIAELQRVVMVGRTVLDHEEVSRIPVACIVPFINTHRHHGNSVADLMFEIQRIKTKMLRAGLDGIELALNPGHAVSNKVTLDDMLVSRPGRLVRLKGGAIPGEGHVMPLVTENVFPHAMQGLQHMDTVTESRVGVNRMFQGIDSSNINDHDRIGQLSTMAAQRVEDMARLFGTGFKRLFSLAHELIIKSGHQQESIKLRGQWVNIDPTQWRTGRDMRIVAPFAAGNKDSLLQRLLLVANIHEKALASGLPIVDQQDAYNLALEIGKAADLPATKFFTDPSTVEPKPPPPDHTMMALEIENKKVDNEATDEARKAELDIAKLDSEERLKAMTAKVNQETAIAVAQINAGKSLDVEKLKADLRDAPVNNANEIAAASQAAQAEFNDAISNSITEIKAAVAELEQSAGAERELIRDEDGRVIGSRVKT